jgi:hypothetical protein
MDAGHGCSTRISVDDCFMRPLDHLVGIIRLLCIASHLQSNQPLKPLSRPIFVALLKSLAFKGDGRFEGVDLAHVGPPQKLRRQHGNRNKNSCNGNSLCCISWYPLQTLKPSEPVASKNVINKRQRNLQRRKRPKPMRRPTMPLSKVYRTNLTTLGWEPVRGSKGHPVNGKRIETSLADGCARRRASR